MYDKENYVAHIRALRQALNHGLILEKLHRVTHRVTWIQN